jgi:hypothetical protein
VQLQFSQTLANDLQGADKPVELYTYVGADNNISQGFTLALTRSVAFFDHYLKGEHANPRPVAGSAGSAGLRCW